MNPIPAILTFFAGALLGGALADGADAFALLFGLGVTGGAFLGAAYTWLTDYEPRWGDAAGLGGLIGGFLGLAAAIIDAELGG